jgi:hypothetical protein
MIPHFFRLTRLLSFPTNTMKRTRKSGAEQLASVDDEVAVLLHALTSGVGVRAALTQVRCTPLSYKTVECAHVF